jgi:hypothetical protein
MMSPREVVLAWVEAFDRRDADAATALNHEDAVRDSSCRFWTAPNDY